MILVTGGTGLVGSHLLYELATSHATVRAIYRTETSLNAVKKVFAYYSTEAPTLFNSIDWVQADILDIPALEAVFAGVTHVYHAAAYISFDPKQFDVLRKVNVEGTANIVNLCIATNVEKLCYVSSIGAIGRSINQKPATEENEWTEQHANVYARTKYAAEMEVWRGSQENLNIVIVNPGVIIGPGFWDSGSGKFFTTAYNNSSYCPPSGSGFVSVTDVVRVAIALQKSSISKERFILVAENLSFKEILGTMTLAMNKNPPTKLLKIWQLRVLRYLEWAVAIALDRDRQLTKNRIYALQYPETYSSQKIIETLNYTFEPLAEVIKKSAIRLIAERQS